MTDDAAAGGPVGSDPNNGAQAWTRVGRGPKRRTRWDRPPDPKDWRFYVGWVGRSLIVLGLLMFLFVAYQLWGTGIEQQRAQSQLENEFEQLLDANRATTTAGAPPSTATSGTSVAPPPTATSTPGSAPAPSSPPSSAAPTTLPAVPAEEQNLTVPERGDAMAYIAIPRIGVGEYVVSGVARNDLKKGPRHFRDTPFPGQLGNAAIAGHRTTYGAPFSEIDELEPGDDIEVLLTSGYQYVFVVTGSEIVTPQDYHVISNADPTKATLTLVTCDPPATSSHRLVVYADLDPSRSGPVGEPVISGAPEQPEFDEEAPATSPALTSVPVTTPSSGPLGTSPTPDTSPVTSDAATTTPAPAPTTATPTTSEPAAAPSEHEDTDAFSEGWFADSAAWPQIALWGLALAALVTLGWWLARFWKREWVGVVVAFAPFFVCLYFFFQNVNRLLPAGL